MILLTSFLVLTVQQVVNGEISKHCYTYPKVIAEDLVRTINESPEPTWKASTYGFKELDLNLLASTKLGVEMDDLQTFSATEIEKLKKEAQKPHYVEDDLPENFSWAKTNRTTCPINTIRDQSNCGSCWAVATASVFSDRYCIKTEGNFTTPFSHQHLLGCTHRSCNCNGGYMMTVFNKLLTDGTVTGGEYESDQGCQQYSIRPCGPFIHNMPCERRTARTPLCKQKRCNNDWYEHKEEPKTYKISSHTWTSAYYNDYEVRKQIYNHGPVVAIFWVYADFMLYKSGIYERRAGYRPLGGHAVKIVGWGVENYKKYWHVANSWGKYWGENGYFRIRRGTNECAIERNIGFMTPQIDKSS
ncbi:hypothetical protein V9T40_007281 [Parthenolecanium corni]|uniref:Peptidase C1A papain C-terminal domain-containing protein n=1 Tax=Parthenolecanium corni TaxID=536013 RepID=A0AAN9U4U3_9HEMI